MKFVYYLFVLMFGFMGAGSAIVVVEGLATGLSFSPISGLLGFVFLFLAFRFLGKAREA